MTVLGYSELVKEIYGVTPDVLREDLKKLLSVHVTEDKISLVKSLALKEKATISELLREQKRNNTGGSFLTTRKFFDDLVRMELLTKSSTGRRTYYFFPPTSPLRYWLRQS